MRNIIVEKPRWYREPKGHILSWEIYGLGAFFINISIGTLEIQINKWSKK